MGRFSALRQNRTLRLAGAAGACLLLAHCASSGKFARRVDPQYGVSVSPRVVEMGQPVPKGGGVYRVGKPYVVAGRTYVPQEDPNYRAEGMASWYGADFHGRRTANGEIFDMTSISAAHPTLPLPCYARVTNMRNGKSLIVRVNDRGPYHGNRIMDLSVRAAKLLDFHGDGLAHVQVEYVGRAPLEGSDDNMLVATLRDHGPAPAPSRVMLASAKPFVPEMPSRRMSIRDVPTPESRPYALGRDEVAQTSDAIEADTLDGQARRTGSRYQAAADLPPATAPSAYRPSAAAYAPANSGTSLGFGGTRGIY